MCQSVPADAVTVPGHLARSAAAAYLIAGTSSFAVPSSLMEL